MIQQTGFHPRLSLVDHCQRLLIVVSFCDRCQLYFLQFVSMNPFFSQPPFRSVETKPGDDRKLTLMKLCDRLSEKGSWEGSDGEWLCWFLPRQNPKGHKRSREYARTQKRRGISPFSPLFSFPPFSHCFLRLL
jgi:hypothetical protein